MAPHWLESLWNDPSVVIYFECEKKIFFLLVSTCEFMVIYSVFVWFMLQDDVDPRWREVDETWDLTVVNSGHSTRRAALIY